MKNRIISLITVVMLIVMTLPAISPPPVQAGSCKISVTTDPKNGASVYIYDDTAGVLIEDGSNTEPHSVSVECCHNYTVWVEKGGHTYKVKSYPKDWSVNPAGDKASGHVDSGAHSVHFHGGPEDIVENKPPIADANGPYEACVGESIIFDGNGSSDPDPHDTLEYRWDFDSDGNYDTSWASSSNATWYEPHSGNVTLEVRDLYEGTPLGTTDTDTAEVTVHALPDCTITADDPVCAYSTGNIASVPNAGAGASYNWTITGGTVTSGPNTHSITWSAGAAGTATIGVTVTSGYGCECSDDITVTVKGPYTLTVISDGCCPIKVEYDTTSETVAADSSDSFTIDCCTDVTLTADDSSVCCAFDEWTGDVPGGTNTTNPITIHIDDDKSVTGYCTGTGPFDLTVESDGCCPIKVEYDATSETVDADSSETFYNIPCCTNVTVSADDNNVCCEFVEWSDGGDKSHTIHMDDNKTVTATCTGVPGPTADFIGSPRTGCAPLTVEFTDLSTGNPTSWSWTFTGGNPSSHTGQTPPSVTYNSPGTYTVSLTVTNDCGSDTETKPNYIEVIVCDGNPVIISVTQSSDEPCADEDVVITAHVTDDVGVTSVTLKYDTTEVPMTLDSGTSQNGYWVATIPGQPAGTTLTIYVIAYDGAGNSAQYGPHDKTWIECVGPVPKIIKTDSPDPVDPGENVTYNITVTNIGSVAATGVTVVDDYDQSTLSIVDDAGGIDDGDTITWDGGMTIPAGDSISYTIIATVSSTATRGSTFYNSANVTCAEGPSDSDTESTRVAGAAPTGGGGGGGCPETKYLTVDWEGNNTTEPLYSNDKLAVDLLGPSSDLIHNLFLERGTHAPVVYKTTHYLIVVRELEEIPDLPENTEAIVVFNITPADAEFNRDIFLTLGVDELPENALNVTMAYYDDINGVWVPLEYEAGEPNGVAELTLSAPINHFSIYGVLAELAPTPPPAHFVPSGLNIVPSVEKIWKTVTFVTKTGESVTIAATITNDGGQEGDYPVELKLDGKIVETKTVTVGVGQSQPVSFTTVSGLDYGQHEVTVAGLSGKFTTSRTITWWLIIVIIAAIGLIIWGVVWGRRRRRKAHQEA